jgi:hypothetical protein
MRLESQVHPSKIFQMILSYHKIRVQETEIIPFHLAWGNVPNRQPKNSRIFLNVDKLGKFTWKSKKK